MKRWLRRLRFVLARAALILFLLAMAVLPMPVVPFVMFFLKPRRREEPALVVRRDRQPPSGAG